VHCTHRGKGDPILFIHGMPTNSTLWDGVIEQLRSRHLCFTVDLPGMGKTPFVPYTANYLDLMAERIEKLRIQHKIIKWHVVGHDAGAAIAAHYAGRFSERVACLGLLSPAIFPDLKPFFLLSHLRKPIIGELLAPILNYAFWKVAMKRALEGATNQDQFQAFYRPFSGPSGAWRLMRLVRWGKPEEMLGNIPTVLASLTMPTLIFHGSRDVLPAAFAERAAALITGSSIVTLDSGHFLPLDRPTKIAAYLRSFFAKNSFTVRDSINTSENCNRMHMLKEPSLMLQAGNA
jgi:pimeloyl-ACP methyl ester carboxylesterase